MQLAKPIFRLFFSVFLSYNPIILNRNHTLLSSSSTMTTTCTCHTFLTCHNGGHCIVADHEECVCFASLNRYGAGDCKIPRARLNTLWNKVFRNYYQDCNYPVQDVWKDLFQDRDRPMHEAKLQLLFEQYSSK